MIWFTIWWAFGIIAVLYLNYTTYKNGWEIRKTDVMFSILSSFAGPIIFIYVLNNKDRI